MNYLDKCEKYARYYDLFLLVFIFLSFNYIMTGTRQLAAAIDFWAPEARTRKQE